MRRVVALQFDLDAPPPRSSLVIIWPEDQGGNSRPVKRDLHWLDVRAGDHLFVGGKRRTVIAVRNYRGEGAANTTPLVESGRDWTKLPSLPVYTG